MLSYKYIVFLLLVKCVIVYSKNHTTYPLNPHLSQIKLISLPKKALFLGSLQKKSNKNESRKKINTRFLQEDPNYENESQPPEEPNFQENQPPGNGFLDESSSNGMNDQQNTAENQYNNYSDNNSSNSNEIQENKQIVNDIAKEENMKEMHNNAGQMLDSAKQAKEKADELLKQFNQGSYTTETNKHAMPKDEAGNIIITNTTTTPTPKKEEEKVDPLKSIRDATLSLFERARHKNLPVPDAGQLSTPEQIYAALNSLEYIIDGYRYSKIDVKDEKGQENNPSESDNASDMGEENAQTDDSSSSSNDEETIMDPDRFLQVKHKEDDDDEDEGDERDEEFNKEDSEEGDQENEDQSDENESEDKDEGEHEKDDKGGTVSPHQAVEDLKEVLSKLTSVLEQVVQENIGVKNVIMKSE